MEKEDRWRNRKAFDSVISEVRGRRPRPAAKPEWPKGLAEAYTAQGAPETVLGPAYVKTGIEFTKWRHLHKFIHAHPFHPDTAQSRGDQWRELRAFIADHLGDPDILAWISEQAEVNDNRDCGLHDWRPRKDDPCHELLLEWVGNKKRTALAIHHFALAEKDQDPSLDWEVTDAMIEEWRAGES